MAKKKDQGVVMRRCGIPLEGPRFDIAVRKADDPCCFKDVDHADDLPTAKRIAQELWGREGRDVIVWDNVEMECVWPPGGIPPKPQPEPAEKPAAPPPKKRGRR